MEIKMLFFSIKKVIILVNYH